MVTGIVIFFINQI